MRHADPHPPGQQDRCANVVSCMAHRNSVVGKTTVDCAKRPLLYPGEGDVARIVGGDVSVQLDGSTHQFGAWEIVRSWPSVGGDSVAR